MKIHRWGLIVLCLLLAACGKEKEQAPQEESAAPVMTSLHDVIDQCFFTTSERISETETDTGFEIRFRNAGENAETVHVLTVEELRNDPANGTVSGEERRDAFLRLHPDMESYAVYENAYHILSEDISVLYCKYKGKQFCITETGAQDGALADAIRFAAGLGYETLCTYQRYENGDDAWDNRVSGRLSFLRDIGEEKRIVIEMEKTGETEKDGRTEDVLSAWVRREDEAAVIQTFDVRTQQYEFRFEDFNCDGYEDFTAVEYYGAGAGSAQHFLWSPEKQAFCEADASLSAYTGYDMDPAASLLHIYREKSVLNEEGKTIRWTGAETYEPVSEYAFLLSDDWKTLHAACTLHGENGDTAQVEADYDYEQIQYYMEELRALAGLKLCWENRVTLADGSTCRLLYGEEPMYIGGIPASDARVGTLYVLDDADRLLCRHVLTADAPAAESEFRTIAWDGYEYGKAPEGVTGTFIIRFEDGSEFAMKEPELTGTLQVEERAQLAAFAQSPEKWLKKLPDAGLYYYYAAADFNRDGRLEMALVCLDANGNLELGSVTEYREDGSFAEIPLKAANGRELLDITEYGNGPAYFSADGAEAVYLMWGNRYTKDDRKHYITGSALRCSGKELVQEALAERYVETDDRGHKHFADSYAGPDGSMEQGENDRLFAASKERILAGFRAGEAGEQSLMKGCYQIKWHADFVWEQEGPTEFEALSTEEREELLLSLYKGWRTCSAGDILFR